MNKDYPDHPFRLSHSMLELLNTCERKFQLVRLLESNTDNSGGFNAALVRGKAFGLGVQVYLVTGDMDRAIYELWMAYDPEIEDPPKISISRTINNLVFCKPSLDKILEEYEVAVFNGKPAMELSFKLSLDEKWYYGGSIDIVLRRRLDGVYVVFECKTTAYNLYDLTYAYKNSGQALGYSIVIDKIAGEEKSQYGVLYFIVRDHTQNFTPDVYVWHFNKTILERLNWFISVGIDYERIKRMEELGIWPMRGASCIRFNRVCQFAGTCNTTAGDFPKEGGKDNTEYDFIYQLQEVIDDHLRRVSGLNDTTTETLDDLEMLS